MARKKLTDRASYRHASEFGVKDDYCIIYLRRKVSREWCAAFHCNSSVITEIKAGRLTLTEAANHSLLRPCMPDLEQRQ